MKNLNQSFRTLTAKIGGCAAALAMLGLVTLASADSPGKQPRATMEIDQLLTSVHELTSYNGDAEVRNQHLAEWEQLWSEDATFVINGTTTFTGRDAIMGFFAGAPFFNNNWVGLSPSFRTLVAVQGNTAEVYLECIFLNEAKTVVAERSLSGTVKRVRGHWRFWQMNNDPAMPLF